MTMVRDAKQTPAASAKAEREREKQPPAVERPAKRKAANGDR
jgi:hypothetical protein